MPKPPPPYMPLWVNDVLAKTAMLSPEHAGAYILLLCHMWQSPDCRLPDDDKSLANLLRIHGNKWRTMRPILQPMFDISDGFWTSFQLEMDRGKVREKSAIQTANSLKRWKTRDAMAIPLETQSKTQTQSQNSESTTAELFPVEQRHTEESLTPESQNPSTNSPKQSRSRGGKDPGEKYAINGIVLRFTHRDVLRLAEAFPMVNVRAQVAEIDAFLATTPPDDKRRIPSRAFHFVSAILAKRTARTANQPEADDVIH